MSIRSIKRFVDPRDVAALAVYLASDAAKMITGQTFAIAFALSGFMAAARKKLDVMGIFILAFLTANGGGVVRDLLVGRTPAIMHSMLPFWLAAGTMMLAMAFRLQDRASMEHNQIFIISDSVGLVAFGITGAR